MRNLHGTVLYMKMYTTDVLVDFYICIGVPLKKRICHKCFPVNSVKFLSTPISIEHLAANLQENTHAKVWFQ